MIKTRKSENSRRASIWDLVVVGGGPAGLMAAGIAAQGGAKVILIEKNETMGKKLLLTGGGRCNLTNAEPYHRKFVSFYGKKGNFLFTPFSIFGVEDTIRFFEKLGLKTKIEPGFRVFPESDNAMDVLGTLTKFGANNGVEYRLGMPVAHIKAEDGKIESIILEDGEEIKGKNFVIATGGKSYPETGSTGDGYKWLAKLGHKIIEPNPSLVPIKIKENWTGEFAGITLEDVGVSVFQNEKKMISKRGRVLFTHDGLSGPTILNMSKDIGELLSGGEVKICIDFFPGVGLDVMNQTMIQNFEENAVKKIKNLSFKEIPEKIYLKILNLLGMDEEWFANEVRKAERTSIQDMFKKFPMTVEGLHGFDKAIVSSGGVDLNEVDFKEMKSKLYSNLFLVGDILDFDRNSGGYSLQICWTTGYIAGKSAVK